MRKAFPIVRGAYLLLALLGLSLSGCKSNKCVSRPTEAQIDIRLRSVKFEVATTRVELTINDQPPLIRVFYVNSPSFRFSFGDLDVPPRALKINVTVSDRFGRLVASGNGTFTFRPNGCNFFELEIGSPDDGGMFDVLLPDAGPDGPSDLGHDLQAPTPDANVDLVELDASKLDAADDGALDFRIEASAKDAVGD